MSVEHTQYQSDREQERARELSLARTRPPLEVPGYEAQKFLGAGAYGEVWLAIDQNTSRQVAIKFYTHRGGLDWSLLSREVEKLVMLSADRYVVQLLDVGWNATPPYYVMEYIETGSLDDFLRSHGPLPVVEAVPIFRAICIGLMHAHGKGVLHCDLKPGNVLIDQDLHPRLADFGQSRLSHEQSPALGTLFFMAPEQADLEAIPDARWDVFALGALLHTMLVGSPPYREAGATKALESASDLSDRLARYRDYIQNSPLPQRHRNAPGVDGALCEIIDRCLAVSPQDRFANVQEVIDALDARDEANAQWPLLVLGLVGPAILLLIITFFGWRITTSATEASTLAVKARTGESNEYAAKSVALQVGHEIERYFRAVESAAARAEVQELFARVVEHPELGPMAEELARPEFAERDSPLKTVFEVHPNRKPLQDYLQMLQRNPDPPANSWLALSPRGVQLAAAFPAGEDTQNIGRSFAWRSYFHGGADDFKDRSRRPEGHVQRTHISSVFRSTTTKTWKVAISAPVYHDGVPDDGHFLGVIVVTVELGDFVHFQSEKERYAVLIDNRDNEHKGVVLQHPLFQQLLSANRPIPDDVSKPANRVDLGAWEGSYDEYVDPLDAWIHPDPTPRTWIAGQAEVYVDRGGADENGLRNLDRTGLIVLVQEESQSVIAPVEALSSALLQLGLSALGAFVFVVTVLWYLVVSVLRDSRRPARRRKLATSEATPLHSMETVPQRK